MDEYSTNSLPPIPVTLYQSASMQAEIAIGTAHNVYSQTFSIPTLVRLEASGLFINTVQRWVFLFTVPTS